ncbi:MAG: Calx-beta domain-containing protein, partial [Arenimonas sp.]
PVQGAAPPGPLPVFPASNWWNLDIRNAPVDANSATYLTFIGPTRGMHPDFGGEAAPGSEEIYGFPYVIADGAQARVPVLFEVWDESDGVDMNTGEGVPFYPIPVEAITQPHWIEGGAPGNVDQRASSDRHLLIVDCTNRHLYELYNMWYDGAMQEWRGYSGAFFDLDTNDRRLEGWTSADASGMAIFPGLVRYDEASNPNLTDLGHALRFTVRDSNGHVYPASHTAGSRANAPPMGTRLRLKALVNGLDPVLRTNDPMARRIFRTMQKYGLILSDNGSDMYISGTFDTRWDNDILNPAFSLIKASDFEVVQLGWNPVALPTISVADISLNEGDSGTKLLTFTATLSAAAGTTVTFNATTANGTATAGTDFVALNAIGLSIPAGQLTKTFSVTVNGDTTVEPLETFQVDLSDPSGATLGDAQAIGYIINNDGALISINDIAVAEGNAGTKLMTFTVSLSQVAPGPVTYNVSSLNGTALAGSDFVALNLVGQVIPQGQLSKTHSVTLNGDTAVEDTEAYFVNVRQPAGASVWDGQGVGYILNDDGPTLSVPDASVGEGASGTKVMTFTVALSQAATVPVTFSVATANTTATAGSDYTALNLTSQTIPAGQLTKTFQVTVNGDTAVEANESFTFTLGNPTGATLYDRQALGTIYNDDGPTLSINDVSISEGQSGTKVATFTATLSQVAGVPITYTAATSNLTATAGSDYVAKSLSGESIPAGQLSKTFTVTLNGDTTVEANETFRVTLSNISAGATLFKNIGNGTISNDD